MQMLNGESKELRACEYFYQVAVTAGSAKLVATDSTGNVTGDVTNSSKTADFTGTVKFGKDVTVTAVLTGDATVALSPIDN